MATSKSPKVSYTNIGGFFSEGLSALKEHKNPNIAIARASGYLTQANSELENLKSSKGQNYTRASAQVEGLKTAIHDYAVAALTQRVGEVYKKIGTVGEYAKKERGQTADVHFKASKNPLKWVSIGRPSVEDVESKIADAKTSIKEARGYVNGLTAQMENSGLDPAVYQGFDKFNAQLSDAEHRLKTAESRHASVKSRRISADW